MNDNGSSVGFFVSIGSLIGSVIAFIAFWTRLSDRITLADQKAERAIQKADSAMQEAAEAKNDVANIREALDEMRLDVHDAIDKMRREGGDGLAALRQHVTEVAFFMRDNFARKDDFNSAVAEIKSMLHEIRAELKS